MQELVLSFHVHVCSRDETWGRYGSNQLYLVSRLAGPAVSSELPCVWGLPGCSVTTQICLASPLIASPPPPVTCVDSGDACDLCAPRAAQTASLSTRGRAPHRARGHRNTDGACQLSFVKTIKMGIWGYHYIGCTKQPASTPLGDLRAANICPLETVRTRSGC